MAKVTMTWPGKGLKTLQSNIIQVDSQTARFIGGQFEYAKADAQNYMREEAPWTDRSGNARAGLHAKVNYPEGAVEMILAHSMWYGIFLEVANSGKYQIIGPTVLYIGDLLMQRIGSMFELLQTLEDQT